MDRFLRTILASIAISTPVTIPMPVSEMKSRMAEPPPLPPFMTEITMSVSIWLMGSLLPLSTSISGVMFPLRFNFFSLRIANTEAASVEETTAPSSMLSAQFQ